MTADRDAIIRAAVDSGRMAIIPVGDAAPAPDAPPPLPPGVTWSRRIDGTWSAGLPGLPWRVGSCRVSPVDTTGPRGGTRRAWVARMAAGQNLHITDPYPTREQAARAAFYSVGLTRHDDTRPDDAITARYREVMPPAR